MHKGRLNEFCKSASWFPRQTGGRGSFSKLGGLLFTATDIGRQGATAADVVPSARGISGANDSVGFASTGVGQLRKT
jgi:hypothetical protein